MSIYEKHEELRKRRELNDRRFKDLNKAVKGFEKSLQTLSEEMHELSELVKKTLEGQKKKNYQLFTWSNVWQGLKSLFRRDR